MQFPSIFVPIVLKSQYLWNNYITAWLKRKTWFSYEANGVFIFLFYFFFVPLNCSDKSNPPSCYALFSAFYSAVTVPFLKSSEFISIKISNWKRVDIMEFRKTKKTFWRASLRWYHSEFTFLQQNLFLILEKEFHVKTDLPE